MRNLGLLNISLKYILLEFLRECTNLVRLIFIFKTKCPQFKLLFRKFFLHFENNLSKKIAYLKFGSYGRMNERKMKIKLNLLISNNFLYPQSSDLFD